MGEGALAGDVRGLSRHCFLAGCGALAGVAAVEDAWASQATPPGSRAWPRVRLIREDGTSLRASDLVAHLSYVFSYPFESTPCFLLDIGEEIPGSRVLVQRDVTGYAWDGGVGARRSILAYSAICPHTQTHPTRESAMINYYGPERASILAGRSKVITCCVHGSAFDVARGAVPLQPPAEVPLAAIVLEWKRDTDALYAVGIVGRPVFEQFFASFPDKARGEVGAVTRVWELSRYTRSATPC